MKKTNLVISILLILSSFALLTFFVIIPVIEKKEREKEAAEIQQLRKSNFNTSIKTIENYVQQQYDICILGDISLTGEYNTAILTTSCELVASPSTAIIEGTGYSNSIEELTIVIIDGKAKITSAIPKAGGTFNGVENYIAS